jgi:transposase
MINNCPQCLEKQRKIDTLTQEIERLKAKLRRDQRKQIEGAFGSATPSSKLPVKPNADQQSIKPKGARPGHKGSGRKRFDEQGADRVVRMQPDHGVCPTCGGNLEDKGLEQRMALEAFPVAPEKVLYQLPKQYCPHCRRSYRVNPPGILPKSLFGNQLIANAVEAHYLHGTPMGRICEQTGIGPGALVELFQRIARLFKDVPDALIQQYRKATARHADETSWRTNGKNGYAWLFATTDISIFRFGQNRSASVPKELFGQEPLGGVLVVDRYSAYNKVPCQIQYCYAHLLRDITDLEKNFADDPEIIRFVATAAPLISLAMGLRSQQITDQEFIQRAAVLKSDIQTLMQSTAKHLAIRHIQDIFQEQCERLYHWADDRRVPADNNLAERDLRPSVIARKVSFGSGSDDGARVRSVLTTVVSTLKKRQFNVATHLKRVLDQLARDINQDPVALLLPQRSPP